MPALWMDVRKYDVCACCMTDSARQQVAVELAARAVARDSEGRRWKAARNLWALLLLVVFSSGCGAAIGGKPEIERHEYQQDGVVCYVATGYGTQNYEVAIACVKTKETP